MSRAFLALVYDHELLLHSTNSTPVQARLVSLLWFHFRSPLHLMTFSLVLFRPSTLCHIRFLDNITQQNFPVSDYVCFVSLACIDLFKQFQLIALNVACSICSVFNRHNSYIPHPANKPTRQRLSVDKNKQCYGKGDSQYAFSMFLGWTVYLHIRIIIHCSKRNCRCKLNCCRAVFICVL